MNAENEKALNVEMERIDWLLQTLVQVANKTNWEGLPITLNAGGLIINGYLISGTEYFKNLFADQDVDDIPELEGIIKKLYPEQAIEDEEEQIQGPSYIHLHGARIYQPGQLPIPSNKGMYWRGRLEAVTGFWLGGLEINIKPAKVTTIQS